MNEGLEMDPNPSSFLPLIFVLHNSTNLLPFTCFYYLSLSKLPPTSDNLDVQVPIEHRHQTVPPEDRHKTDKWTS